MKIKKLIIPFAVLLIAAGCSSQTSNPAATTAKTPAAQNQSEPGHPTLEDLAGALAKAHDTKNADLFLSLYYNYQNLDAQTINSLKKQFSDDFSQTIETVKIIDPNPALYAPITKNGITFKPQLDVIKVINLNYKQSYTSGFPVGISQGRYFLVTRLVQNQK